LEIIDSHCHLDLEEFEADREAVIERARQAGVVHMITIGIDSVTSTRAIALAERHADISASVGYHPHEAKSLTPQDLDRLKALARRPKVVGFGEIGLDFYRDHSPRPVQRRCFDDLLQIGLETGLPLIIHDRDAHEEILDHLIAADAGRNRGVIHCYSGDYELARRFLDLGFYLSIPGTITFPKADMLRDVVARVPLDVLLVETDAPFLAPVPRRGRRNEPALVEYTTTALAGIKGISPEDAGRITSANARTLFNLPENKKDRP